MMKLQIARDARPQARMLIIASAISVALWLFVPYGRILTYPFQLFVTFIHEGGHALAAVLTGNSVRSLSVSLDTSGLTETLTPQGGLFSQLFISSAGYLGAMAFGALLLWLVRHRVKSSVVLVGSAVIIAGLTSVFGFLVPLTNLTLSPFTIISGGLITAGLVAAAIYASRAVASFLVSFLAVQCVLNAIFNLRDLTLLSLASDKATDAVNMYNATGIHPIIWALVWAAIAFVILSFALRAYAISRERPSQPDLPFEDPMPPPPVV